VPQFEGIDQWLPRVIREALSAAASSGPSPSSAVFWQTARSPAREHMHSSSGKTETICDVVAIFWLS
jgi:hypothetical protein